MNVRIARIWGVARKHLEETGIEKSAIAALDAHFQGGDTTSDLEAAHSPSSVDSEALEHRNLAMGLSAALIQHIYNSKLELLREFADAAALECNRLHVSVFNRTPFNK
jgi:hypothetical protein